jgi:hypothetical protein
MKKGTKYPKLLPVEEPVAETISNNEFDCDWFALLENSRGVDCKLIIYSADELSSPIFSSSSSSSSSKENNKESFPVESEEIDNKEKESASSNSSSSFSEFFGEHFGLHRSILGLRFPVLYRQLQEQYESDMEKFGCCPLPTVKIEGDAPVWELLLAYVYAGTTHVSKDTILPLLQLAREYDLDGLYGLCLQKLNRFVSNAMVPELLAYAEEILDERLESKCIELAARDEVIPKAAAFEGERDIINHLFEEKHVIDDPDAENERLAIEALGLFD